MKMLHRSRAITALLLSATLLGSCGKGSAPADEQVYASGAKSAIAMMHVIAKQASNNRPSGMLGIFTGVYLAQGIFLPVQTATEGIASIAKIIQGQLSSTSDENFAVLREVGGVLQVNIPDALNRSANRSETLDTYTQSLRNTGILLERKIEELKALEETLNNDVRDKRSAQRDIERKLSKALAVPDYAAASDYQEQLATAKVAYTEADTKQQQTKDMLSRFQDLLDIAVQRMQVVENNREILLAGLRVIDLPGISDLNILEKGKSWNRRSGQSIFTSPTGTL